MFHKSWYSENAVWMTNHGVCQWQGNAICKGQAEHL
jgi:hypothetical protein